MASSRMFILRMVQLSIKTAHGKMEFTASPGLSANGFNGMAGLYPINNLLVTSRVLPVQHTKRGSWFFVFGS
jgi:hypothetical protein